MTDAFDSGIGAGGVSGLELSNIQVDGNVDYGIDAVDLTGLTLNNVVALNNSLGGLWADGVIGAISISGGRFSQNSQDGMYFQNVGDVTITNVAVEGNDGFGLTMVDGASLAVTGGTYNDSLYGMYVLGVAGGIALDGVTARLNTFDGAHLDGDGTILVNGGMFSDNGQDGLDVNAGSAVWVTIEYADFRDNAGDGIAVEYGSATIRYNNIVGNDRYGVEVSGAGGAATAENNWWGSYAGPGATDGGGRTGDAKVYDVDASPWSYGEFGRDSDGDHLYDGHPSNPDPDNDGDGYSDVYEVAMGMDPLTPDNSSVVGRHIFYNNSKWDADPANPNGDPAANAYDDNAIAAENSSDPHLSKTALLPGQTATFNNYTSYSLGINGIMVDFDHLPGTVTAADFEFKMGNTATPDTWLPAPAPLSVTVRQVNGIDRVTIIWADGAIQNTWLQVTVKATANTGLAQNDVFYYGNAVGESGNSATDTLVNGADDVAARLNPRTPFNPAAIDNPYDYNRDRLVNSADQVIPRYNATTPWTMLKFITAPAVVTTNDTAATDKATAVAIAVLSNDSNASGALSVSQVDAASSLGASLAINADQTIRYDPSVSTTLQALLAGQSLSGTCTYTIQDNKGLADTATGKVLVSGLNKAPGAETGAQRGWHSKCGRLHLSGRGHPANSRGCRCRPRRGPQLT